MPTIIQQRIADQTDGPQDTLLAAATTAGTKGTWRRLRRVRPFTVTVRESTGAGTFTVRLRVANGVDQPTNGDTNYPQIGADITTMAAPIFADGSYEWIMAELTAVSGGATVTVALGGG